MRLLALMMMPAAVVAFMPSMQPGVSAPLGFFDPLGFSKNQSPAEFRKFQECEVKHGRVAMLAALGLLVQDVFHPLVGDREIGSSIYHYQIASAEYPWLTPAVLGVIGVVESVGIARGWNLVSPLDGIADLRDDYVPGDLSFDPLGLASEEDDFIVMRTRELNNGRLAMIASVIIVLQQYFR